eukprot:jgi/Astpho2/7606/Aster-x0326
MNTDPRLWYVDLFTHADGSGRQTWRLQFTPNGGVGLYASGREGACGLAYASQGPPEAQLAPEASQWELVPGQCGGDILGEQNGCPCPRLSFRNPVINQDFADPEAFEDNGTVYFFSTNAGGCNIQVTCTQDYRRFHHMQDALPQLPQWADPGLTWAPSVIKAGGSGEGHSGFRAHLNEALRGSMGGRAPYLMYFVARQHGTGNQVVGVAEAQYPGGPYKPAGRQPLVTQHDKGGTIDPYAIRVGDSLWLLFKSDGNSKGLPCIMSIAPLTPDGLQLAGPATDILRNDLGWEGHVIEAPCLIERNNKFYLFYSGNDYGSQHYAVGVAIAEQVTGPYKKLGEPILRADMGRNVIGPGACSVIRGNHGMDLMAYHSWDAPPPNNKYRAANVASVFWNGDIPSVVATWGQIWVECAESEADWNACVQQCWSQGLSG